MQRLLLLSVAILALVLFHSCDHTSQQDLKENAIKRGAEEHGAEHLEVAVYMGRIQQYHQKWWLAGKLGNAELAAFYLHEMEEAMEAIAEADAEEDGVKLKPLMESYGLATIERLEAKLKAEGVSAMHAEAGQLVMNCNACHAASGHPFIRIRVPESVSFPDQVFAPVE